jgi:REP element-mobilizing transposase RayT
MVRGFACYAKKSQLPVWACAILPDHVHLVIGRISLDVQQIVIQLERYATRQLIAEGIHPQAGWKEAERLPKC